METLEFISYLRDLDVRLAAEGERLRANAPKGTLTEELRSQIAERKAELLSFLRVQASSTPSVRAPISRRVTVDPAPLSFAQERLWFLEQLEPASGVYNICRASRLSGRLDSAALEASLSEIVRRHEVLRSEIRIIDGRPMQVTASAPAIKLSLTGLRSSTGTDRENEVRRRIKAEAKYPFDLSTGPFLRARLLQIGDEDHILILTTHHIVSDAWSMGILTRELWTLHEAYAAGKTSPLKDLSIQYADFAVWQKDWLQGEVLESQLSYWKKQLNDIQAFNLPTDRPRPPRQSFHGTRYPLTLPRSLTASINELSHGQGVTSFMTLLAAFQVLLYRYSGQEDVVVGSPIANRGRTELESLIGFFVNTLVLRADLSGNPSFKALLSRVRDVCLGAYAHQDLPFEKLVHELQPERDLSRNPLFQVMFVLQNATRPLSQISSIRSEPVEIESGRSQFDLSLFLRERDGKLIGYFEYSTDLFERDTIERMAGHFQTLLEGIVADPGQPIATLPILTETGRHQILVEWNDTGADYPKDSCIHELFEAQVERTPDAIALEFEGEEVTYRELNQRANQLGHYLISLGVGPERLVGICVERSIEMVVGLLAILKAGGAYVPLDPAYPIERLVFIMQDAQFAVLLTQERMRSGCEATIANVQSAEIKTVCVDRDRKIIDRQSHGNLNSGVTTNKLAYIIYTSGSTGQPKGVAIEHKNTAALLDWTKTVFTPDEMAGVLASTSICFDLSVFELFAPLSWGGKVVLVENALHLHETAAGNQVTLINTVPSIMTVLLDAGRLPQSVRVVNLAGEPLRPDLVDEIYQTRTVEKVYDLYGPSETTTYSTFMLRTMDGLATIGRPISNTQVYILDSQLQPVPKGVPGEIYIGGKGVARGYLNRPELTSKKFVPNPYSDDPESRLYRAGDLARYLPDGNIEFLGRVDNQVKIRGYRIELEEIESALNQHPAVKESVVVARQRESSGEKDLAGYIVLNQDPVVSLSELRGFLHEKLPDYMLPSVFVILNALPLNSNGKVDRSKLPPPVTVKEPLAEHLVRPPSEIEELIANAWSDVLQIEKIGVNDNFFELGGHSLLATQVVARLSDAFNREIPLKTLFDAPSIAGLAGSLESIIRDGHAPELPPIVPVSRDRPLALSMNQEHLWHLDRMIPDTHFFNMPYVYQLSGALNVDALGRAIKEIVRRHDALRTVFGEVDGKPVQMIGDGSDIHLTILDLRGKSEAVLSRQAAATILEERYGPFNLAKGPLLRTKLLRLTDEDDLFLVTMHHIIGDHWSMLVFRRELAILYEAFSQGRLAPLPELSIQFADFACWERQAIEQESMKLQLVYWKKQLATPLPELKFQKNGERRKRLSFQICRQPIAFDENLFVSVKALARKENCTPFLIVLTALNALLYLYTGETDIPIGTLVANRRRRETEGLIGHFVNTVVLRTRFSAEMTFSQLLKQVREITLSAYAHQELPFEHLTRVLDRKKDMKSGSLFQVLLSYQNWRFQSQDIAGLNLASVDMRQAEAEQELMPTTFDLIFNLREASTMLTGTVNYKVESVDEDIVHRMRGSFGEVLQSMIARMEQRFANLSVAVEI
ncbi:MAG: amino acid adenylation domain-containing protein [Candidatus Binatia bacterium]